MLSIKPLTPTKIFGPTFLTKALTRLSAGSFATGSAV